MLFKVPINVFNHHHGRVHHHADADRQSAERHEVCGQARVPHQNEGHQHTEGNCRRGDERAAKIAEQQHENNQHQYLAFDQRFNYRVHAAIDKFGLIVEIDNGYAFGQSFVDLGNFFPDAVDHLFGVFVDSLENYSSNDFSLAVFGDRALTDLVADFNCGNVAYPNRRAAARIKNNVLDIFNVFNEADTTIDLLLVAMLNKIRAGVLIVVLNCFKEGFERDVVVNQRLLIDDDLILLDVSAKAQHVGNTWHCAQLQFDDPILNRAQLLIGLAVADNLVKIDLACTRRDGPHLRFESGRNVLLGI